MEWSSLPNVVEIPSETTVKKVFIEFADIKALGDFKRVRKAESGPRGLTHEIQTKKRACLSLEN